MIAATEWEQDSQERSRRLSGSLSHSEGRSERLYGAGRMDGRKDDRARRMAPTEEGAYVRAGCRVRVDARGRRVRLYGAGSRRGAATVCDDPQ